MKSAIILDAEAYKKLEEKIDIITNYILEKQELEIQDLENEWVDNYDVCNFLRISERTLQRLRTRGVISYTILSGKVYYTIAEIKRILKERLVKTDRECIGELMKSRLVKKL